MEKIDSLLFVPNYWNKSKTTKLISFLILFTFLLYVLAVFIWQHVEYATARDSDTKVYQSSQNANVQHFFKLTCHDPLGCVVGTRLQIGDDDYFPPWNPNDPCNTFNTQYYQMKDGDTIRAAICYARDPDNGVAVLIHNGGSVRAYSAATDPDTISDDTDWPDTLGYQTMISMTAITVSSSISGDNYDNWIILEKEDQAFPLTGDFFRCSTPSQCGCNTTFWNQTNSNCEAFIFRLDEIGYIYNEYRTYSYLVIIAQIVSLSILGYVVLRAILAAVFQIEKRVYGDTTAVPQQAYSQLDIS
jgi:hypothetical protein